MIDKTILDAIGAKCAQLTSDRLQPMIVAAVDSVLREHGINPDDYDIFLDVRVDMQPKRIESVAFKVGPDEGAHVHKFNRCGSDIGGTHLERCACGKVRPIDTGAR